MKNIKDLEKEIQKHNELYWEKNEPIISDQEYDILIEELKQLNPDSILLKEIPDYVNNYGKPVKHKVPMLSMGKAYSLEEVKKWAEKTDNIFISSVKLDGASCSIVYKNGIIYKASTRGNGLVGDDITENVKEIINVPKKITDLEEIEIRGEVIMPISFFEKNFSETNSNPRNMAAGSLKHKNAKKSAERGLVFYAYNLLKENMNLKTENDKFKYIKSLGFDVVSYRKINKTEVQDAYDFFDENRENFDFEIDGVIFTANNLNVHEELGNTSHHPKYSIAWKFQGESATTILKDIEWSVSRTGQITPVAIVKPVSLSGAVIRRASVHHANFVLSKKLSKDATIEMTRRGMVIPHVERVVVAGSELFYPPKECPICNSRTEMKDDFLYCTKKDCPAVEMGRIEHFVKVCEIDGIGKKLIKQLYEKSLIHYVYDLFFLTKEELCDKLDRIGEKSAQNIIDEINKKRKLPLNVFLRSIGIEELGKKVSSVLAEKYKTIEKIQKLEICDLEKIDGIGPQIAEKVISGLLEFNTLIFYLLSCITIEEEQNVVNNKLNGKSFVFTGALSIMGRKEAQKKVIELGGKAPSSVSKDLNYLVVGGNDFTSSKCRKAEKYGIKIITENIFQEMIGN